MNANLNIDVGGGGVSEDPDIPPALIAPAPSQSSFMLPLSGGSNLQGPSSSLQMQNNAEQTTEPRRVSRDSIVSRDSLSDLLGAGNATSSNNLDTMNLLSNNQQQQQIDLGQLMMNSSALNMNQVGQLSLPAAATSMMNPASTTGGLDMNAYGSMASNQLVVPPKKPQNRHKLTFAQKLMHILSLNECQTAIRWMPNGCAFCIVDSQELVENVLPRFFKEAKYTSFVSYLFSLEEYF